MKLVSTTAAATINAARPVAPCASSREDALGQAAAAIDAYLRLGPAAGARP